MRIDAHQHFWHYDPVRYGWIDDCMGKLKKDFLPRHLEPLLKAKDFDGCVAVQADTSEEDTFFLLKLADQNPFVKAVVGWVDLKRPDLDARLESFAQHPKLKGIRHTIQSEAPGFMTEERFVKGVAALKEHHLAYDILISEDQLEECVQMLGLLPEMNLVVDHIAKPNIKDASFDAWKAGMKKVADFPHVRAKLSGLVTEADWQHWSKEELTPYLETCLELFGPDRLMIGSDWPVCLLAAEYEEVIGIVEDFIGKLARAEQKAIMGKTAAAFYNISDD